LLLIAAGRPLMRDEGCPGPPSAHPRFGRCPAQSLLVRGLPDRPREAIIRRFAGPQADIATSGARPAVHGRRRPGNRIAAWWLARETPCSQRDTATLPCTGTGLPGAGAADRRGHRSFGANRIRRADRVDRCGVLVACAAARTGPEWTFCRIGEPVRGQDPRPARASPAPWHDPRGGFVVPGIGGACRAIMLDDT